MPFISTGWRSKAPGEDRRGQALKIKTKRKKDMRHQVSPGNLGSIHKVTRMDRRDFLVRAGLGLSFLATFGAVKGFSAENAGDLQSIPAPDIYGRLANGVNVDAFQSFKIGAEYFRIIKAAGFKSIRLFHNCGMPANNANYPATFIRDAVNEGLVVIPVMWVPKKFGKQQFVDRWKDLATAYKDLNDSLAFEMFNEPSLEGGVALKDNLAVMDWINEAVTAIRKISPTRMLLIGGPQMMEPEYLVGYVTPEYLTYSVDGINFSNDPHVMGAVHYYQPWRFTVPSGSVISKGKELKKKVTLAIEPNWKKIILEGPRQMPMHERKPLGLNAIVEWSVAQRKRAVLTEWGAQNDQAEQSDFLEYTKYFAAECKKRGIPWLYYTSAPKSKTSAVYVSRWSILNGMTGTKEWYPGVLEALHQ
jgi:hypothetical protein